MLISIPVEAKSSGEGERASLIIGRRTAMRMVGLLLRRQVDPDGELGMLERSTLQELGIDLDAVTDRLQVDGVEKFAKAFNQMIQTVGEKLGRVAQGT